MKNLPLVQKIQPTETIVPCCDAYRVFWLETDNRPESRKLIIQPAGTRPDRQDIAGLHGYAIAFPEEFLLMAGLADSHPFRLTAALPGSPAVAVDLTACASGRTIEHAVTTLADQFQRLPKGHMMLSGLVKVLLVAVSRLFQETGQSQAHCADRQLFERFMSLVGQHHVAKKGMQDYARTLSIRTEVLSEAIKRVSGFPASHHIYQHIIRTAKHAAIGSGSTMKEVAFGLGFKDVAHFSKFFRNKAGMTFSEYKKAYQLL